MPAKILPNILLLQLLLPTCLSLTIIPQKVWISEVNIGENSQEDFIEFYDGGSGNFSLDNFTLYISSNNISEKYPLDSLQTNSNGFLVLSAKNTSGNKEIMERLGKLHNANIEFNLTHSMTIQTITRRHFQTNLVICYEEVAPILLVSNVSTEGSVNNCPRSPVHIDQISLLNDSTLDVILHSDGLPNWKLKSLMVSVTLDGNLTYNSSLDGFTTDEKEIYKLKISVNRKQEQTVAVLLNFISNTSGPIILDGVAFGKGNTPSQNLTKIWTYPDLYLPREQEMQYIELSSNNASMVKFCHCNLFSRFFAASELAKCPELCFHYDNQRPRDSFPATGKETISTSASSTSSVSGTTPSSSTSNTTMTTANTTMTTANTTMTTASETTPPMTSTTNPSGTSTQTESEMTTNVNEATNSGNVSSTPPSIHSTNTTNTEIINDASTASVQNTTTSNVSTTTHETSTSNYTTVDYTEETTSNLMDITSPDNNSTISSTTETPHTSFTPSSSTQSTSSDKTVPDDDLKINEIRVGQSPPSNNWVELNGTPSGSASEYKLVWSDLEEKTKFKLKFNNLKAQTQQLINIDQKMQDDSEFLRYLSKTSGVLKLYKVKSNQLVDCLSYMISNVPVKEHTKAVLQKPCLKHPPVLITQREISAGWTINYCGPNHFQVAGPSYNTLNNSCPSTRHRPLSMVLQNVQKTYDFEPQFEYEFVRKISEEKGCMISKDFIKISNVTTHFMDEQHTLVIVSMYGYNASHLQTLYNGYESLFAQNKTVFKINEKNITVYRKSTFVDKLNEKKDSSNASVTVAVLLSLLAIFVLIVVTVCLYMRYKKNNLTNLFSKLYFKPDQDDLLVNMEEVGAQESHFNNPYYNQLTV